MIATAPAATTTTRLATAAPTIEQLTEQLAANLEARKDLEGTRQAHVDGSSEQRANVKRASDLVNKRHTDYVVEPSNAHKAQLDSARTTERKALQALEDHKAEAPDNTALDADLDALGKQARKIKARLRAARLEDLRAAHGPLIDQLREDLPKIIAIGYHLIGSPPGQMEPWNHMLNTIPGLPMLIDKQWAELRKHLDGEI